MWRHLLIPFSWVYAGVVLLRNMAYDAGIFTVHRGSVPVIAVGNLTAGGTGKTPLVKFLARLLIGLGRRVAVVSRGYGRRTRGPLVVSDGGSVLRNADEGGDEPVELARGVPGLRVIVAERRIDGVRMAEDECGADVILLDDAYQHRSIHRDLNILVLESGRPVEEERLLPAGLRREPLAAIRRADCIAWSGAAAGVPGAREADSVRQYYRGAMIGYRSVASGLRRIGGGEGEPVDCRERHVVAFCGIGRPERFFAAVRSLGPASLVEMAFGDHHRFRPGDIDEVILRFRQNHGDLLVTTEKDAARLDAVAEVRENFLRPYPVYALGGEVQIVSGEEELKGTIARVLGRTGSEHTQHQTTSKG